MPTPPHPSTAKLGDIAATAGLERIHVLAWRDLDDPEAGGSELHIHEVARRWAAAGIRVTMRTSHAPGRSEDTIRDGYRVIRRAGRYLVFPRAVLSELAGRHGPSDALVEIWNGVPFLSPVWHRGPRLVLLHHMHADMFRMVLPPNLARFGELIERRLAPPLYRRSQIATLSDSSREELLEGMRLPADRVAVVPPGIDPRFRPDPSVERSPEPLLVAVGRLVPVKRHHLLIEAVAEARRRIPGIRLRIIGEGYEREDLEALVAELGAHDWVELPGRVDDDELVRSYQEAWAVVSSSSREGWGMTITEAAACGTPAVATDIAGHADAVDPDRTGLLCREGELADALVRILGDEGLRTRLGEGALERARALTWDATAVELLRLLAAQTR